MRGGEWFSCVKLCFCKRYWLLGLFGAQPSSTGQATRRLALILHWVSCDFDSFHFFKGGNLSTAAIFGYIHNSNIQWLWCGVLTVCEIFLFAWNTFYTGFHIIWTKPFISEGRNLSKAQELYMWGWWLSCQNSWNIYTLLQLMAFSTGSTFSGGSCGGGSDNT